MMNDPAFTASEESAVYVLAKIVHAGGVFGEHGPYSHLCICNAHAVYVIKEMHNHRWKFAHFPDDGDRSDNWMRH